MTHPYREGGHMDLDRIATQALEMNEACKLLHELRRFKPVIAGGALWSWAAGVRPRDIDIFMANGWSASSHMKKRYVPTEDTYGHFGENEPTSYRGISEDNNYRIIRYRTELGLVVGGKLSVDLILTPWDWATSIDHFDYEHCRVSFGENGFVSRGAPWYAAGKLEARRYKPRTKEVIMNKVQPELWGNPDARLRLHSVFSQLDHMYKVVHRSYLR